MPQVLDDPDSVFQLLHPLGRGSYGAVYKARVIQSGEIVAVKIIPLAADDEIDSIQKEIAILRDCKHPNIVKYYGSFRTPDALWIVMEHCAGGSVSDVMHVTGSGLTEQLIKYIAGETLTGLAYLHSVGKVHRDIKCGNILLTENGEVKLADFGVAAQLTNTMSKRNTFIGTPHWMAPEVIQTSHYDGKVDIWALGITVVEMAEQMPPRWNINPNRVIFMIVKDPSPKLADTDRWSLTFQDFIAQCLQKDVLLRPTAKFLQQHRFLNQDKSQVLRSLTPMIQKTRAYMAEIAAATSASGIGGTIMDAGTMPAAAVQDRGIANGGHFMDGATVGASNTVIAVGADFGEGLGTFVHHESTRSIAGTAIGLHGEVNHASGDYSAALNAMADLDDVDLLPALNPPWANPNAKSDVQKLRDRLHTIYTGGSVVPLPFLRATDACPVSLITKQSSTERQEAWEAILEELICEKADIELLTSVRQRVQQSIVLMNLLRSLSYHENLLKEQVDLPVRLRDHLKSRSDEMKILLRTVLCV